MPQASEQDRDQMEKWFGDAVDSRGPAAFLESHGWKLTEGWEWKPPTPYHSVSCYELACIRFLIDEWDYGFTVKECYGSTVCLCGYEATLAIEDLRP